MCVNFPQWRSLSGPGWVYWLWMECGACYDREPWYTPETRRKGQECYGVKNRKHQFRITVFFVFSQTKKMKVAATHGIQTGLLPLFLFPQTFRASRLLLISAPSRRVWRSALDVSAPLSFPARSMRENLPCIFPFLRRMIWKTAWLRDEWAFADVCPDVLWMRRKRQRWPKDKQAWRNRKRLNNCWNILYFVWKCYPRNMAKTMSFPIRWHLHKKWVTYVIQDKKSCFTELWHNNHQQRVCCHTCSCCPLLWVSGHPLCTSPPSPEDQQLALAVSRLPAPST